MKILVWNVRGTGAFGKRRSIKEIVCLEDPDVLFLQEVKREFVDRKFMGSIWKSRFKEWILLPSLGRSGGLLMAWDTRRVQVINHLIGEFSISIQMKRADSIEWWFTGVYGPPNVSRRGLFWDELVGLWEICGDKWCVGGDFNVTRRMDEKFNSHSLTRSMETFDEIIRELALVDPPLSNAQFTWSNFRSNPICCRLDRFLFSSQFGEIFDYLRQFSVPRWVSDHSPIVLSSVPPTWGPPPFRFDNIWLEHRRFKQDFENWWNNDSSYGRPGFLFMRKLRAIRSKLSTWKLEVFGDSNVRKKALQKRLLELDRVEGSSEWDENLREERTRVKKEWEGLLLQEERAARIKSKFKWAKEGDANTKLFHRLMNARKSMNAISKLEGQRGELITDSEEIVKEITMFFSSLYTSGGSVLRGMEDLDWSPICNRDSLLLERPFEEEEVKRAIFESDGSKSPGPDGFSMAFFQFNWEVLKGEILQVIADFYANGIMNKATNETYIALIPKKIGSSKISDFRPISLVTSLYKIISKVLAARLKTVLESTVAETQGAFVAERQILDSVLVANEVVEETRVEKKIGLVFKVDFQKAYDHVEWEFLDFVLEKKGFGSKWRSWIRGCLSSISFSVIINGRPRGKFGASRGLRQGDPLSPFLFTLVVDVLGRMMERARGGDSLRCLEVGRERIKISHLQFADDTLFFLKGDEESVQSLRDILDTFCEASGLKINFNKSSMLGINIGEEETRKFAEIMGCEVGNWPIKYLGLPLGDNPSRKIFWEPVISKIARRLDGWKRAFLSRGGRYTLIKSVLSALPTYYLSLFKVPISVAKAIETLMRDFLWGCEYGPHSHLVPWKEVSKPRSMGGLEIGNIVQRNSSLLGKWLWRFAKEPDSLWFKVIHSRYGSDYGGWISGLGTRITCRSPWKGILTVQQEFLKHVKIRVGNGERVKFWLDIWNGNECFATRFPSLFHASSQPNGAVKDYVVLTETLEQSWNLHLRRGLRDCELLELEDLLSIINRVRLSFSVSDRWEWLLEPSGLFTCRSFFKNIIRNLDPRVTDYETIIWKVPVPSKVQILGWLLVLNKVNTHDTLQQKQPYLSISPGWCVMCRASSESRDHLFLLCPVAYRVWCYILQRMKVSWASPGDTVQLIRMSLFHNQNSLLASLWWLAKFAVLWTLWIERNRRIFDDIESSFEEIVEKIDYWISLWASIHKELGIFSFQDWIRGWNLILF